MPATSIWVYIKLVLVTAMWGGTFVAGRVVSASISPAVAAFGRFAIASVFLLGVLFIRERHLVRVNRRQMLLLLGAGMTGIFTYNILFFSGLGIIEANRASLIIALNPIVIILVAALIGAERITAPRLLGVIVALFGVAIVLTQGELQAIAARVGRGELLIFGCVLSWSAYTLIGRALLQDLSALVATTYACVVGCVALLFPAARDLAQLADASLLVWAGIAYLGIAGTGLGFLWYYDGVRAIGPTRAGIFINLVPAWAVLLAALLLGEVIHPTVIVGGAIIIAGVTLTNRRRTSQAVLATEG